MRQLTVFLALCATLVPAATVAGCGSDAGVPGSAVATVDGEAIEQKSFDHWLTVVARTSGQARAQVPKPGERGYAELRDQVVKLLVSYRWLEGEAEERGISVDRAQVEKDFERQKRLSFPQDADFQRFLESSGQSEADILTRVRFDLLASKIHDQVLEGDGEITEQQISEYYDKNKARLATPERRDLRVVLTRTKAEAERAKAELARGRSWSAVARAHSTDKASSSQGGKQLGVTEDMAPDAAVFKARKGKVTGPLTTPLGYYLFEVTRVRRASPQTLEKAEPTIKQLLASENQQEKIGEFTRRFTAKWRDRTECREGFATPDCKNGPEPTPTPG